MLLVATLAGACVRHTAGHVAGGVLGRVLEHSVEQVRR